MLTDIRYLLYCLVVCAAILHSALAELPPPTTAAGTTADLVINVSDFANLFTLAEAPITPVKFRNGTDNICYFVQTPQNGTSKYDCDPGFFCPTDAVHKTPCPLGFYCPNNTAQPLYCCEGYYCPSPQEIKACSKGYYCPKGSARQLPCNGIASCPKGTISPKRVGVFGVVVLFILFVFIFFSVKGCRSETRRRKYFASMAKISASLVNPSKTTFTLPRRSIALDKCQSFDIQFSNLGYVLPNGTQIMSGVSGELKAGRLCAIMGPSGSGKSTFVNLLTGKTKRSMGSVSINGLGGKLSMYKKLIGFVPQDDVMIRELTVLDTLMHSAKTRLPASWTRREKSSKVLETIDFLGLSHVMNDTIGDEMTRGLSGGQRKRVNIGMELVAEPSVLFLDEPTSGLDSSTSYELCNLLQNIAREQLITVAVVIHGPSPASFKKFDDILILVDGGRIIYFGERSIAMHYFKALGYEASPQINAADFMLDIASGKVNSTLFPNLTPHDLVLSWERYTRGDNPEPSVSHDSAGSHNQGHDEDDERETVGIFGKFSAFITNIRIYCYEFVVDTREYIIDVWEELSATLKYYVTRQRDPVRETPNGFVILWLCLRRALFQIYRSPGRFILDQLVHLGCGAFISIASEDLDYLGQQPQEICKIAPAALKSFCENPIDQLRQVGVFISLGVLFAGISSSISTFGDERVVYWREFSSGQSALPYFLAKVLADLSRVTVASFMFTLSLVMFLPYRSYFMVFYAVVFLLYYSGFAMGYFISTFVSKDSAGLVATGMALSWSIVFSGVVPSLENVKHSGVYDGISWLWDLSPPRYAVEALYLQEVKERPFHDELRYTYRRSQFGMCLVAIFLIGTGWNLLALITMKLVHREKMR